MCTSTNQVIGWEDRVFALVSQVIGGKIVSEVAYYLLSGMLNPD